MANELSINSLLSKFTIPDKGDWVSMAAKESGLADPLTQLTWNAANGLSFLPVYDGSDTAANEYNDAFALRPAAEEFRSPRFWLNMPPVAVADAGDANDAALDHLAHGADGIFFLHAGNIERTLEAIDLGACEVSFPVGEASGADLLDQIVRARTGPCRVNLLWQNMSRLPDRLLNDPGHTRGIRALGILVGPGDAVDEIAGALSDGVTLMDRFTDAGLAPREIIPHIHFSFAASNDFFVTMGKLRAMRIVWYQIVRAYGVDDFGHHQIFIHARCGPLNDTRYEPHATLVGNTTASIAAVCGGCDGLTVFPRETESTFTGRIARNVSTILADEAHLNKVADPFAGSYFVETLTRDLARTAWKAFQSKPASP